MGRIVPVKLGSKPQYILSGEVRRSSQVSTGSIARLRLRLRIELRADRRQGRKLDAFKRGDFVQTRVVLCSRGDICTRRSYAKNVTYADMYIMQAVCRLNLEILVACVMCVDMSGERQLEAGICQTSLVKDS